MKFEIGLSQRAYANRRGVSPKAVRKAIASGRIATAILPDGTINADLADRLWEANTDPSQRRGKEAERAAASMASVARPQASPSDEAGDSSEDAVADGEGTASTPTPAPRRRETFEEDPPRRRRREDDEDEDADAKVIALAQHIAANRARARANGNLGPAPGVPSEESAELAETLLTLAVEEKREKVRKLKLANDKEEGTLVAKAQTWDHFYTVVAGISEAFQVWPDKVGPELAGKWTLDAFAFTQDLKEAVREQLKALSSREAKAQAASKKGA